MASPATAVTYRKIESIHNLEDRKGSFSGQANWNGRILAAERMVVIRSALRSIDYPRPCSAG